MGSVEGDVGDVDFEVFIGVGFTSVTLQREGFPLGGEGGVGDEVGERVTAPGLVRWEWVRRDGMVDKGGKSGGEVVTRDMGSREVVRVVGRDEWCVGWWAYCRAGCVWWAGWERGWEPQYFLGGWGGSE